MPDKQLADFLPILFVDSLNTRVEALPIIINEYLEREIYPPFCPLVFLYFEQVQNIRKTLPGQTAFSLLVSFLWKNSLSLSSLNFSQTPPTPTPTAVCRIWPHTTPPSPLPTPTAGCRIWPHTTPPPVLTAVFTGLNQKNLKTSKLRLTNGLYKDDDQ